MEKLKASDEDNSPAYNKPAAEAPVLALQSVCHHEAIMYLTI